MRNISTEVSIDNDKDREKLYDNAFVQTFCSMISNLSKMQFFFQNSFY